MFTIVSGPVSGFVCGLVSGARAQSSPVQILILAQGGAIVVDGDWVPVPVGPDAERWVTARTERTVVAVVHTVASAGHVLDAVELLERDPRIQVVFTQAPDVFSNGVSALLNRLAGVVVPWHQATRSRFDLAVAADANGVHDLHVPVLSLPHGVMNNKRAPAGLSGDGSDLVVGLAAPWLTWYGRLVPAVVALSHEDLRGVLARQCPQALPAARVVGDLCLDRLVASRANRHPYRHALGVASDQVMVAVSSTWGRQSLFGRSPALPADMLSALPRERYVVAAALHPAVWYGHGPRQVLAWLRQQRRDGLVVVDPVCWRGLVAAADVMVGDHGSATVYAAAAGVPVLRAPPSTDSVRVGSAVAALAEVAPAVNQIEALDRQLDQAVAAFASRAGRAIAARVTSHAGLAARLLRTEMYRLLDLTEPVGNAETAVVGVARPLYEEGV